MKEYKVVWTIDIDADSPREAAEQALVVQRGPGNEATFFEVYDKEILGKFEIDLDVAEE